VVSLLTSTMSLLDGLAGDDFKKVSAHVFLALRKLLCGADWCTRLDDVFIGNTAKWITHRMQELVAEGLNYKGAETIREEGVRSFCALFRYKSESELFGVRLRSFHGDPPSSNSVSQAVGPTLAADAERLLETMAEQSSDMDEYYYADVFKILVYTHPFCQVLQWVGSSERGNENNKNKLHFVLEEVQKCLSPMIKVTLRSYMNWQNSAGTEEESKLGEGGVALAQISEHCDTAVRQQISAQILARWLLDIKELQLRDPWARANEQAFKYASMTLTVLFGPDVVCQVACSREIHEDFVAESKLFYEVCRGMQATIGLTTCTWQVRQGAICSMMSLADSLELCGRPRSGHPSSWSALISTLVEFLKGAIPDDASDESLIQEAQRKIEGLLSAFEEDGKLQEKMWGAFWHETFWSISLLFPNGTMPMHWHELVARHVEKMQEYVDQQVGEHRQALKCAKNLLTCRQS